MSVKLKRNSKSVIDVKNLSLLIFINNILGIKNVCHILLLMEDVPCVIQILNRVSKDSGHIFSIINVKSHVFYDHDDDDTIQLIYIHFIYHLFIHYLFLISYLLL
jgi:hypothetical protein